MNMKRHLFAALCTAALLFGLVSSASALEGDAVRAGETLSALGLFAGTEYRVKEPASRLSAVSLVVSLSGKSQQDIALALASKKDAEGAKSFQDVAEESAAVVEFAAGEGWVSGVSADTFAPDSAVTANAWFTMLLRMLGYRDSEGDFEVSQAPVFARRIGLTSRTYSGSLTRGQLFESAKEALLASYRGGGLVVEKLVSEGVCSQTLVNALGIGDPVLTARQTADRHMAAIFRMALYDTEESITSNEPSAEASGFFITPDGVAVTNYHSIDGAMKAVATLVTDEKYELERVLWYDVDMDLAVVRVSKTSLDRKTTSAFACLQMAGTEEVRAGDVVYTLSNPLGYGLAVSNGVVSAVERVVERYAQPCIMNTADISQGSSGGALLNVYGRVIGVTSGAYRAGNNMYLAVPVDPILTVDLNVTGKTLSEVATEQEAMADGALSEKDKDLENKR